MFERRVKALLIVLGLATLVVLARLVQLQVLRAEVYREEARKVLLRPVRLLPCVRGRVLDRAGRVLAEDAPSWDVCVPYGLLAGDPDYLTALAEELQAGRRPRRVRVSDEELEALRNRISSMWPAIAEATATPLDEIADRRDRIVRRVRAIRRHIQERNGLDRPIVEERRAHPVARGLDHQTATAARIALAAYPWVSIVDSTRRRYVPEPSLAHILGRLADPGPDAVFAQELSPDLSGASGVEALAEDRLRGTPGQVREDIDGRVVAPPVAAQNGGDVQLTIDALLQHNIYERLALAVREYPQCTGAAAVVLDVPSREVLALVSYPAYDPNLPGRDSMALEADRKALPLANRPIALTYPPGSTVKPLVLAAALMERCVTPDQTVECHGRLFAEVNAFRCTGVHGPIAAAAALAHSCNIYFFTIGESLGVGRLESWLASAGLGRPTGIGLPEERAGQLPIDAGRGMARNTAVGQGELEATPLQVANMTACVADGMWRPVTVLRDDSHERPRVGLGVTPDVWRVVRSGMYATVNEPGGTAYHHLLPPPPPWVLLGKTGSAQPWRRTLERAYTCEWPDGRREEYFACDDADLARRLAGRGPYRKLGFRAHRVWPPPEQEPATHAWFVGYLIHQDELADLGRPPSRAAVVAVVIEYAGHGGEVAAPVAGDIIRFVLDGWPT